MFAHNSSKNAVWFKEDPFWDEKCVILKCGVLYPKNTPIIGRKEQLSAKIKCRTTSKRLEICDIISISHEYETGVALSDSINKTMNHYQEVNTALSESDMKKCVQRPLAED